MMCHETVATRRAVCAADLPTLGRSATEIVGGLIRDVHANGMGHGPVTLNTYDGAAAVALLEEMVHTFAPVGGDVAQLKAVATHDQMLAALIDPRTDTVLIVAACNVVQPCDNPNLCAALRGDA